MAADVALRIDVGGRRRAASAVQVLGDGLRAEPAVGVQVEDLRDDDGLFGDGDEPYAGLRAVALVVLGHRLLFAAVAVGRASAHAEALLGALAHPALRLAAQLRALELVPELLHADEHLALGGGRVACAGGVVDRHADALQLALEQCRVQPVASEA
ncbi:MAG TPA: hypothetical protein VKB03_08145 [Conexibacter sp.]|nr:hypothetical protein [Conexibacter sp.]